MCQRKNYCTVRNVSCRTTSNSTPEPTPTTAPRCLILSPHTDRTEILIASSVVVVLAAELLLVLLLIVNYLIMKLGFNTFSLKDVTLILKMYKN